ncbi:MAG: carboxylating nicotinate-nucleotide diphosphorylase [Balneolaceae bacterium]
MSAPSVRDIISHDLERLLTNGFQEDIGFGDPAAAIFLDDERATGHVVAKADGVLCATEAISLGYRWFSETITVTLHKRDGDRITAGEEIATAEGPVQSLLAGERVILNLLQHASGIATATARAIHELNDDSIRVCDTRKTIPGLRALQKYAVRCGGGYNHRMRLDAGVMIKDNHIAAAGSITEAVARVRRRVGHMEKIEVECETESQIREAVAAGVDVIMLDNASPEEAAKLRNLIPDTITVEVSGGITPETIGGYAGTGVDVLSMGSLTHSVQALDISFLLDDSIKNNGNK